MAGKCIFCIFSWGGFRPRLCFRHPHSASSLFSILKSAESAEGPLSVSWNCLPVCPMVAFASYWSFYWSPSQCWFFKIAMLLISKLISRFRHVTWIGTEDIKIIFSLPLVKVTKVFFKLLDTDERILAAEVIWKSITPTRREDSRGWGHLKF